MGALLSPLGFHFWTTQDTQPPATYFGPVFFGQDDHEYHSERKSGDPDVRFFATVYRLNELGGERSGWHEIWRRACWSPFPLSTLHSHRSIPVVGGPLLG